MKITIIGISATGKSTLARRIQKITNIEPLFSDTYIWGEKWTLRDIDTVSQEMLGVLNSRTDWIYEGYLTYIADYVLTKADIIIYLDYSGVTALFGILNRWLKYRKVPRPEFAKGCEEKFLWNYYFNTVLFRRERAKIEQLLKENNVQNIYRFRSRKELNLFIETEFLKKIKEIN
jgi:adenylate kinase family enzyme